MNNMFFKKKKVIKYRKEMFEVGKTKVLFTLKDEGTWETVVYGYCYQFGSRPYFELKIEQVVIVRSEKMAGDLISNFSLKKQILVDDILIPTASITGIIVSAFIIETVPHRIEFDVAYIEEE